MGQNKKTQMIENKMLYEEQLKDISGGGTQDTSVTCISCGTVFRFNLAYELICPNCGKNYTTKDLPDPIDIIVPIGPIDSRKKLRDGLS